MATKSNPRPAHTGRPKRVMAPIAPRGGDSGRRCTAAVPTNGGVRLRRRRFVLCAIDRHGVKLAVSGQFLRKSELRRLYELYACIHELLLIFRDLQNKLGIRRWDEFARAQRELGVLFGRICFIAKRYKNHISGEPMPDSDDSASRNVNKKNGAPCLCRGRSCECWYSDLANLHSVVDRFV